MPTMFLKALEEQRKISLSGASSSLGLLCRQAIDVSSLGTWPALENRLAPLPFRSGLLFDGGFQQEAEKADKGEEQLKRTRSYASKRAGSSRQPFQNGFRANFYAPAPRNTSAPPRQQVTQHDS